MTRRSRTGRCVNAWNASYPPLAPPRGVSSRSQGRTGSAALQAASRKVGAAHRGSWIANKLIQIESAESTLAPLREAIKGVYEAKRAVDAARAAILTELQPGEDTSEVFHALQAFDLRRMESRPILTTEIRPGI